MSERGSGAPLGGGLGVGRRGTPVMTRDQQAVYLSLTQMRVSPEAAALMAKRHAVAPSLAARLRAEHARDARQADLDKLIRTGGQQPSADDPKVGAAVDKVSAVQQANQRNTVAAVAAAAAIQRESTLPQPQQSLVRSVIIGDAPDRGGKEDVGGILVRNVGAVGPWVGRKLRDEVESAPAASTSPVGPGGPIGVSSDTPKAAGPSQKQRDPNAVVADALDVAGVALGIVNPPTAIAMMVLRRAAARADASGMSL